MLNPWFNHVTCEIIPSGKLRTLQHGAHVVATAKENANSHPLMSSRTIFLLLLTRYIILAEGQACTSTACDSFIATINYCAPSYGPNTPPAWVQCVCQSPSDFDAAIHSCYDCDVTVANQVLVGQVQELLNLCASFTTSATLALPSGAANSETVIETVTPQTSPTSSGATATSKPSIASPKPYFNPATFWLAFIGIVLGLGLFAV